MKIIRHFEDVPASCRAAIVAIGNFDGVHRGHQALIARASMVAKEKSAPLGVLAFEPHPQEFFRPEAECFRLTPFRSKARLLSQNGVNVLYAFPFDAALAKQSAEEFVRIVLVDSLGVRGIVIGDDFRFGKERGGNAGFLEAKGRELGFSVELFAPVTSSGEQKISSTDIRTALRSGRPEEAAALLGHWWTIEGHVQNGDHRGRELGYPTANLNLKGYLRPAFGVYAVRARVVEDDKAVACHAGVANLGGRPMFKTHEPLLETHLLGFSGNLYGKHLAVELISYLRPELNLDSVEALKSYMKTDVAAALAALDHAGVRC
ncbi:MAG: bifunctional riboflavin kinase/FAD synthetase [Alphaproteobacteria bacterium]|nr:bifunctional riboflavin kinase/FAD synthetase [Alphaproteobacteria bacterium]